MLKPPAITKALASAEKQRRYREKKKLEGGRDGVALWLSGEHAETIAAIGKIMGISHTRAAGVICLMGLKKLDALTKDNSLALREAAFPSTDKPDDLAALETARQVLRDCFGQQMAIAGVKL